ncbi:(2R)-3-sulfolactate dehydrogenase (NADP+) [Amorphus suaedae]
MSDTTVSLEVARAYVARVLEAHRTSADNAALVADALVMAEADGLKGHGLSRLDSYSAQAASGKVDGQATPTVDHRAAAAIAVDGANGFAYPAIDVALTELEALTPKTGVAAAGIRRSHHCGAAGHHVERLARYGLVGLMFANTPEAIAPWGGSKPLFGTNPIAFAVPVEGAEPLVVDLSLSKVARGNIMKAKQEGKPIPEGWALGPDGAPTTDPEAALKGTMVAMGDAKGAALALVVEILAAGLTGANFASEATNFFDAEGAPPGTGQLILAFSPPAFGGDGFARRMAALAGMIEGQEGARLPGRRRFANREKARRDGIALPAAMIAKFGAV